MSLSPLLTETLPLISQATKDVDLVPSPFSNHLYVAAKSQWGRFWQWIYSLLHIFDPSDRWKRQHFEKIVGTFYSQWEHLVTQAQQQLLYRENGARFESLALLNFYRLINMYAGPDAITDLVARVDGLFKRTLAKESSLKPQNALDFYNRLTEENALFELEVKVSAPLDYRLIENLIAQKPLQSEENHALQNFLQDVAKAYLKQDESHLGVRTLHQAIKQILKKRKLDFVSLPLVEWELHKRLLQLNCPIFLQRDDEHVQWVKSLCAEQVTQKITLEGKEYSLGLPMPSNKRQANDTHLVFLIENDKQWVCRYSLLNEAALGIEQVERDKGNWGLPIAERKLSSNGLFCLEERLFEHPHQVYWDKVAPHYKQRKQGLIAFLHELVRQSKTPVDLNPNQVLFDGKGKLKFTNICESGPKDLTLIHEFIEILCGEDERLYSRLIYRSGLGTKPLALKQREAIASVLRRDGHSNVIHQEMGKLQNTPLLWKKSDKVESEALNLLNEYCDTIMNNYIVIDEWHKDKTPLQNIVAECLISSFQQACVVWRIVKGKRSEVLGHVLISKMFKMRSGPFESRCKWITNNMRLKGYTASSVKQNEKEFERDLLRQCEKHEIFDGEQIKQLRHYVVDHLDDEFTEGENL